MGLYIRGREKKEMIDPRGRQMAHSGQLFEYGIPQLALTCCIWIKSFLFLFFLQDKSVERVSKNWQMMGVNLTNWHKERIDAVLIGDANWRLRF